MAPKTAGIIIIGDEILKGHVEDTNSHFLCKRLHGLGVKVCKMSVVSDEVDEISAEVVNFSQRYDIVFTSGGIGPTHDDITYLGVAKAFNQNVEVNKDMAKILARFYEIEDLNDIDGNPALKMAQIPEHSKLLYLPKTFMSVSYDSSQTWMNAFPIVMINNVYIFPGIPRFFEYAAMNLEHLFKNPNVVFHTRELCVISDEVPIAPSINRAVEKFRGKVTFGSYPSSKELATRIIMEATSKEHVEEAHAYLLEQLPDGIRVKSTNNEQGIEHGTASSVTTAAKVLEECCNKYNPSEVFISFNGGKDCTALLHLTCEILCKTFPNCKEPLQGLYIQPQDPFPEVEAFIKESVTRYNIKLKVVPGPIKRALGVVLQENPHLKAVLMGTRRTDPYSDSLTYFQMTDKDWPQVMRVSPLLDWSYKDVWMYLKDHSVPYCILYDKGYTSLGSRHNTAPNPALSYTDSNGEVAYYPAYTLEDGASERNGRQYNIWNLDVCLKFLESLENLTSTAFGPEGRAVMIQKPNGQLNITRSGHNIICSTYAESNDRHPVLQMLLKYVDSVHESLGDGTKTFIIMLASMLRYSKVVINKVMFIRHLHAFQACLSELTYNCSLEQSVVNINILNDRETCFSSFINTFFSTRFSEPVRNILSPLICKWILSYSNGCDQRRYPYSKYTLKKLQQNFAFLCEYRDNSGRPLADSSVQKGFKIACCIANLLGPGLKKLQFLMLEDGEKPESGQFSALDVDAEVSRFLLTANDKDTLLITTAVLSDLSLFRLRCSHIAVLHGLQHEDVDFIYSSIFHVDKTEGIAADIRPVVENGKEFVYLDLPDTFQLHICGPTAELNAEYAKECYNVLKLLVHAATTEIPHIVEIGGVFEKCLSIKFTSAMGKNSYIPLLGVARSRTELLELHKELQRLSLKQKSDFDNSAGDGDGVDGIGGGHSGGGNTPSPVINIYKNLKNSENSFNLHSAHDFKKLCNTSVSVHESCFVVNHLLEKCCQMDESLLTGIAIALQSVQRKLPANIDMQGLEPLALKLSILHHVINAVISLLRIEN